MKKRIFLLSFIFLSACAKVNSVQPFDHKQAAILLEQFASTKTAQHKIAITLPSLPAWTKRHDAPLLLTTPPGNKQDWNEAIQTKIHRYRQTPIPTMSSFVQNELRHAKERCAQTTMTLLSVTAYTEIYQLEMKRCRNNPDEKQISKVFKGQDAIYCVSYSAKIERVSDHRYAVLSRAVQTAQLVNNKVR